MHRKRPEPTGAAYRRKGGPLQEEVGSGVARTQALWISSSSLSSATPKEPRPPHYIIRHLAK